MIGGAAAIKCPLLPFCAGVIFVKELVLGQHGVALPGLSEEVATCGFPSASFCFAMYSHPEGARSASLCAEISEQRGAPSPAEAIAARAVEEGEERTSVS